MPTIIAHSPQHRCSKSTLRQPFAIHIADECLQHVRSGSTCEFGRAFPTKYMCDNYDRKLRGVCAHVRNAQDAEPCLDPPETHSGDKKKIVHIRRFCRLLLICIRLVRMFSRVWNNRFVVNFFFPPLLLLLPVFFLLYIFRSHLLGQSVKQRTETHARTITPNRVPVACAVHLCTSVCDVEAIASRSTAKCRLDRDGSAQNTTHRRTAVCAESPSRSRSRATGNGN